MIFTKLIVRGSVKFYMLSRYAYYQFGGCRPKKEENYAIKLIELSYKVGA